MDNDNDKTLDARYREAVSKQPAADLVREMAGAARVSAATAMRWVYGYNRPSAPALELLSRHFGIPADRLFTPGHFDRQSAMEP